MPTTKKTVKKSLAKDMPSSQPAEKLRPLQRLSLGFFKRPGKTAMLWILVTVFGLLSYTTFLKREGFPSIETPFAIAQGTYLVNDSEKVDQDVAKPLNDFLLKQDGVKSVQSQSGPEFFSVIVNYSEGVKAESKSAELSTKIRDERILPEQATLKLEAFKFGFTERGDSMVLSFYAPANNVSTQDLAEQAKKAAQYIKDQNLSLVKDVSIINPYETAINPVTGQSEISQKIFDRFAKREGDTNAFYNSVVIGISAKQGADNIELDTQVQEALNTLNNQSAFKDYHTEISASFAPQIEEQISELQGALLEGLLAVLVVGSIVIAVRASVIIIIAMLTVIAITNALLLVFGYSLNTITLFALILGLALIVDDTIIMTEALDAQRKRRKNAKDAVKVATGKVSRAMIAATSTAALSFAPLLFVGGILGGFIRAIPVTIITALVVSLIVALIFIPLFARFLLLGKNQMGKDNVREVAAGLEERIAGFISKPMLLAKNSRKKLVSVGLVAVVIGFGFIGTGVWLSTKVGFNIFPPSKDSNQVMATLTFPPNTDIEAAQTITDKADKLIGETIGKDFVDASYYGQGTISNAILYVNLTPYNDRGITAPEIVEKLDQKFTNSFSDADVKVQQVDAGPPASPFTARIDSSQDREAALRLADDVAAHLKSAELKRTDGSIAQIKTVSVSNSGIYTRDGNNQYISVTAQFVDTDTTTLVTLAKDSVNTAFNGDRVASYGLKNDAISFNFGQEDENQESFATLALAFPALLVVIYVLLAIQFKSLLQPLLIFMAIPFSLFGITLGLYMSDNPFSFFAMLGFFALIGLSIKNTILLTDYANQSRKAGKGSVDAAHEALAERFRPLVATSLTAIVSLIPLAIMSPFWEGLAVVLIGGLLSSTFLVVTVFPYYYLGSEFLRTHINRRTGLAWILLSASFIALAIALGKIVGILILIAPVLAALVIWLARTRVASPLR